MATTDEKFLNGSGLSKVISWIKSLFQPKQMGTTADFQSKAVVTNSSGVISTSTVTATELGTLSGIGTKSIASQLNGKQDTLLNGDHIDLVDNVIDAHEASTSGTDSAPSVTLGVMGFALPDLTTDGTTTQDNNVDDYVTEGVRGYNSIIHLRKANPSHYGVSKLYASTGTATDGTMTQKAITSGISDAVGGKQDKMTVGNGTAGAVTTISAGTNIGIDISNGTATIKNTYSLPTMTNAAVGGAKVFSNTTQTVAANAVTATAGRTYGVQKNSSGQLVVNVPWTDTPTDISGKQDHNIGSDNGSKVLVTDSSGNITASPDITTTELGYLNGLTENLSTTLGNKQNKITIADSAGTAIITAGAEMTIKPGTNVTFTKEATSGNFLEISAKDTTYSEATTSMLGLVMAGSTSATGTGYTPVTVLKATTGSEQAYNGRLMMKHADENNYGVSKLYTASGTNEDGTMTQKAVTNYVASQISSAMTDAAMFQGVVNAYTAITGTSYKKGWYWIVGTPGMYAGEKCEVGDQIWAKADKGSTAANTDFNVVQTNIDTDVYVRDTDFLSDTEINNIIATAS